MYFGKTGNKMDSITSQRTVIQSGNDVIIAQEQAEPILGTKDLAWLSVQEDFIVRTQVSETVLLKHTDGAWLMERKISKDMRSGVGLANCTGDRKINTKIRLTTLKGKGRQNICNIYPNIGWESFPNSLTEKLGIALKSCTKSNILCIHIFLKI